MSAYPDRGSTALWSPGATRMLAGLWILISVLAALAAVATGSMMLALGALLLSAGYLLSRQLESWPALLATLVILIFAIPIKRYRFRVDLPFDLEPYRILVLLLAAVWVAALLIDRRVRLRPTYLDVPLLAFFLAILASVSVNVSLIKDMGVATDVIKSVMFIASFVVVYLIAASVIRTRKHVEFMIRVLVLSAGVVAVFGIVEFRTETNYFDSLSGVLPILEFRGELDEHTLTRSDRLRVYASAQHPIAAAAVFALLLPLGVYLAMTTRKFGWWLCTFAIGLGVVATLSRTGIIMTLAAALVLLRFRPIEGKRLLPLAIPAIAVTFVVLPNSLGTLKTAFFPKGGLFAEQTEIVRGNPQANDRLADIGPSLAEWRERPAFGQGFGSRIVLGPRQNAYILDNQWVASLVEIGAIGVGLLLWLFVRSVRGLGRVARGDPSTLGFLAGALGASIASYAFGLFFYDGFSFVQVTFAGFLLLALSASVVALSEEKALAAGEPPPVRRSLRAAVLRRIRAYRV
jgi:hypothetical protein